MTAVVAAAALPASSKSNLLLLRRLRKCSFPLHNNTTTPLLGGAPGSLIKASSALQMQVAAANPYPLSVAAAAANPYPLSVAAAAANPYPLSVAAAAAAASSQAGEAAVLDESRTGNEQQMKKVFVAGSTGNTGRQIVQQLLAKGFRVRAGVLDVDRAKQLLPSADPKQLQIVRADVTEGPDSLSEAIGDAEAVVCATGFRRSWDPFAPWKVDNFGTVNLVEACRKIGVNRFVLISSILVNGAAMGQILNPAYIILNLLGLTLIAKLQAEQHIRRSGINYTIIRPGGLKNDYDPAGNLVMKAEDTLYEGSISRKQVAEVAVEALLCPDSSYKVVEIIVSRVEAPKYSITDLFKTIGPS